jgi:hypothetical protein
MQIARYNPLGATDAELRDLVRRYPGLKRRFDETREGLATLTTRIDDMIGNGIAVPAEVSSLLGRLRQLTGQLSDIEYSMDYTLIRAARKGNEAGEIDALTLRQAGIAIVLSGLGIAPAVAALSIAGAALVFLAWKWIDASFAVEYAQAEALLREADSNRVQIDRLSKAAIERWQASGVPSTNPGTALPDVLAFPPSSIKPAPGSAASVASSLGSLTTIAALGVGLFLFLKRPSRS